MPNEITLVLKDSASPILMTLVDTLSRLERLLSGELLAKVAEAFEHVVNLVEASGGLLRVVTSESVNGATGLARECEAELQVSDRLGEFLAALHAIERDLELVCQSHGILQAQASPGGIQ